MPRGATTRPKRRCAGPLRCVHSLSMPITTWVTCCANAAQIYRAWLEEEPDNPIARHYLIACTGTDVPARASDAFVEAVFDRFAASFDSRLEGLLYRAPEL